MGKSSKAKDFYAEESMDEYFNELSEALDDDDPSLISRNILRMWNKR